MDAEGVAHRLESRNALAEPTRLDFRWSLSEPDLRAEGRGVVRAEPGWRARLDLFTENAETVVGAALVEGELRLPPGARGELIPPPALFWATLGVFRPGEGAVLQGGERDEGDVVLRYRLPTGDGLRFRVRDGHLVEVELRAGGHAVERVALEPAPGGFPTRIVYRHLADFRELELELESTRRVAPFPPDIWDPGGDP